MIGPGPGYATGSIIDSIVTIIMQAAWLRPSNLAFEWRVPVATIILLIPFFV